MKTTTQHFATALALLAATTLTAMSATWDGGGGDEFTGTDENWVDDTLPGITGSEFVFGEAAEYTVINNYIEGADKITFIDGAGSYTLSGNEIAFPSGGDRIMNESNTEQTIALDFSGGGGTTFLAQGDNSHTHLTGNLSGFISLTFTRETHDSTTPQWTLSGNNTHGVTHVASAIVHIENASAVGTGDVMINASAARFINTSGSAMTLNNTLELRNRYRFAGEDDITFNGGVYLHGSGSDHRVDAMTNHTLTLNGDHEYRDDGSSRKDDPFIKEGIGTVAWNMTPVNTTPWVGGFTVNAGTLVIDSNVSSNTGAVTVAAGAVLGGSGSVGGATTISGSLQPGNSIGTFTVHNDVTWNGSEADAWVFELGSGNTSDKLMLNGGAFLKGAGDDFIFDLAGSSHAGTFTLVEWTSDAELGGGMLGTSFGLTDFTFTNLADGYEVSDVSFDGSSLQLTVIPEPHTLGLLFAAGALLALRRRASSRQ